MNQYTIEQMENTRLDLNLSFEQGRISEEVLDISLAGLESLATS